MRLAPDFQFDFQPQSGGALALVSLSDAISTRIPGDTAQIAAVPEPTALAGIVLALVASTRRRH